MSENVASEAANKGDSTAAGVISEEEVSALLEGGAPGNVKPYDLTAVRINRTRLPMLETICKSFAEKMALSLSALVGRDAAVQFSALDSAKSSELQASLPVPSSLAIVRLKPLDGNAFVSVDPVLLLALLDGFFGGSGRAPGDALAAVAPAAQRFLGLMLRNFSAGLTAAFAPVAPLELELVKQETNPRLMQLGAPQEVLLALRFSVECGARSGRIDWLLPEAMLAPLREALSAEGGKAPVRKQENWAPILGRALHDAEVDTRTVLAQAEISLGELVRLAPGDIIPIDTPQQAVLLAGEVLYRGRFGVSQGRNALKITAGGAR